MIPELKRLIVVVAVSNSKSGMLSASLYPDNKRGMITGCRK